MGKNLKPFSKKVRDKSQENHLDVAQICKLQSGLLQPSDFKKDEYLTGEYLYREKRKGFTVSNSGVCNLRCPYCVTGSFCVTDSLDKDDFAHIFKYFGENIAFVLSGIGDFFCGYKEKDQLLRFLLHHDVAISYLDINGVEIHELGDLGLEGKEKIDMIDISYHYGAMKKARVIDRWVNSIGKIHENMYNYEIKMIVSPLERELWEEAILFYSEGVYPITRKKLMLCPDTFVNLETQYELLARIADYYKDSVEIYRRDRIFRGRHLSSTDALPCPAGSRYLKIANNGDIVPCEFLGFTNKIILGNLKRKEFATLKGDVYCNYTGFCDCGLATNLGVRGLNEQDEPYLYQRNIIYKKLQNSPLPQETNNITVNIERFECDDKIMKMEGWAFVAGESIERSDIYVVLKSDKKVLVFIPEKNVRRDVASHFRSMDVYDSGFQIGIARHCLESGEYKVGILVKGDKGDAFQFTDKIITIESNCNMGSAQNIANDDSSGLNIAGVSNKVRILLCGYYFQGNTGDDLLMGSIVETLSRHGEVKVTSTETFDVELLDWCQLLVIGAGSLITPRGIGGYRHAKYAKENGKKVVYYSQTIEEGHPQFREHIARADLMTVRDFESKRVVEANGFRAVLASDPIFKTEKRTIGFSFRRWVNEPPDIVERLASMLDNLARDYEILSLPYTKNITDTESDTAFHGKIIENMKRKPKEVDYIDGIEKLDLFIGMRLHALINAINIGKVVMAIDYDAKVRRIFSDLAKKDFVVSYEDLNKIPYIVRNDIFRIDKLAWREKVNEALVARICADIEGNFQVKVSIVMPTYNMGRYLKEAVDSILAQTISDWELVLIDDGSTDDTRELVESYKDRRIKYYNFGHNGIAFSRNIGNLLSRGEIIVVADSDDLNLPDRLEVTCQEMEKSNADIMYSSMFHFDNSGKKELVPSHPFSGERLKDGNFIYHPTVSYRRDVAMKCPYAEDLEMVEDYHMYLQAAEKGYRFHQIEKPLVMHRIHDEQISSARSEEMAEIHRRIVDSAKGKMKEERKGDNPLVSVVVPTYNRPDMLRKALTSVLSQTYPNIEIIVVNDAGMDVQEVIDSLNMAGKIVYVRHEENRGLPAARNTGIKRATGKYIAYLDDDDSYYPNHLETLVNFLENSDYKVAYADCYHAFQEWITDRYVTVGKKIIYSQDFDRQRLLVSNYIPVLNLLHRRDIVEAAGLFDETLGALEDWEMWIRFSQYGDFHHINVPTAEVSFRDDGTTMTSRDRMPFLRALKIIHKRYAHLVVDSHILEEQKQAEESLAKEVEIGRKDFTVSTYEYLHRYRFAMEFVRGKKVLDLCCGEGYGGLLLSETADSVVGLDGDEATIRRASSKYIRENLTFIKGSLTDIPIKEEKIFDVMVCFSGIEHIQEQDRLMREVKKLLKPTGVFIVSIPNRCLDSRDDNHGLHSHGNEISFDEFQGLLSDHFKHILLYGQKIYPSSNIFPLHKGSGYSQDFLMEKADNEFLFVPLEKKLARYFIGVASDKIMDKDVVLGSSHLLDLSETLFHQRDARIGNLEAVIRDKDTHIGNLEAAIKDKDTHIGNLEAAIRDKDTHIGNLERQREENYRGWRASENNLKAIIEERQTHIGNLERQREENYRGWEANENNLKAIIEEKQTQLGNLEAGIREKDNHISNLGDLIRQKEAALNHIYSSHGWKALLIYYRVRDKIFPANSRRRSFAKRIFKSIINPKGIFGNLSKGNPDTNIAHCKAGEPTLAEEKTEGRISDGSDVSNPYLNWIKNNEPAEFDLERFRNEEQLFKHRPKISLIVPSYNTPEDSLIEMVESTLNQAYSNWELCIADGSSIDSNTREILKNYILKDDRIKVRFLDESKGIAGKSNEALALAGGEFIGLLNHDDTLAPFALYEVVKTINENPDVDFIYSDEDKITVDGKTRLEPHFKTAWAPDTMLSYNYIGHLSIIKKVLVDKVGGFRQGYDGSQDYDLFLRTLFETDKIVHIPKILYHSRISANSLAGDGHAEKYSYESAKKALRDHLSRLGLKGEVEDGNFPGSYRVRYDIEGEPKVSIIIPNKDKVSVLKKCVDSILEKSTYKNYEIIIVENNSIEKGTFDYYGIISKSEDIRVVTGNEAFNFSALNNLGVKNATGEFLVFLNNDTEVITSNWIENMLEHAQRKDIGAVGAKLYYPDGRIQHAGVVLGLMEVAGHHHYRFPKDADGYMGRLKLTQNLSAVTGACMMMRKEVFNKVDGFDEGYSYAYNDIDLCMKLRGKGYLIIFTPYVELYHHESLSRGNDDTPEKRARVLGEVRLFRQKWGDALEKGDPYYNPNLTLERDDFGLRIERKHSIGVEIPTEVKGDHNNGTLNLRTAIQQSAEVKLKLFLAAPESNLEFPKFKETGISIIIVTYNKAWHTYKCLESLKANADVPYEIIIVDNASHDETGELLRRLRGAKIIWNTANYGFVKACNQGSKMVSGRYILFLNNDTEVLPNSLSKMVATIENDDKCGAVGARLILPDGKLQEAGDIIWRDGTALGYGRHDDPFKPEYSYLREVDYCSGACLLVRADLFIEMGGFDERYAPAYYEEADFCLSLRRRGNKVLYQPAVNVIHYEFGSSSFDNGIELMQENQIKFVNKWKDVLKEHYPNRPENILFARDKSSSCRILAIDDRIPALFLGAGYPRAYNMLLFLADLGYKVTFFPMLYQQILKPTTEYLENLGIEIFYHDGTSRLDIGEFLNKRQDYYDIILISRPHNAKEAIEILKEKCPKAAIIYDAEALFSAREIMKRKLEGINISEKEQQKMINEEISLLKHADVIVTVSEEEKETIVRNGANNNVMVWGHSTEIKSTKNTFSERQGILFVGGFIDPGSPNADSILYFAEKIYPIVRNRLGVKLFVVGSIHPDIRKELNSPSIIVTGHVDDLMEYYEKSRVFIVPTRYAAGIPLKLQEAMSYGLPSVITPLIGKQIRLTHRKEVLIGGSAEEFAENVILLYEDEMLWNQLRDEGFRHIKKECNPQKLRKDLSEILEFAKQVSEHI